MTTRKLQVEIMRDLKRYKKTLDHLKKANEYVFSFELPWTNEICLDIERIRQELEKRINTLELSLNRMINK